MCEPMSIAALALTAAGTAAQIQGQRQAKKAWNSAQSAENARQSAYQQEGMGYFDKALDRSQKAEQDKILGDATTKRGDKYTGAVKDFDVNTDMLFGQQSAPEVVRNTVASKVQDAVDDQRLEGLRKALLDAWGDTQLQNAVANQRSGDKIGMVGRFANSSAGVLPLELEAAKGRGSGMRSLGSALQAGGMITGMAGAGSGISWGDLFGKGLPTDASLYGVGNMPTFA
jgi:hypothetical protein